MSACVLMSDILESTTGDGQPAMDAIAGLAAAEQYPGGKDGELHVAEHPAGHLVLKWLLEQDKKMKESGKEGRLCSLSFVCVLHGVFAFLDFILTI